MSEPGRRGRPPIKRDTITSSPLSETPPEDLDPVASEVWTHVYPMMDGLTELDEQAFRLLCETLADQRRMYEETLETDESGRRVAPFYYEDNHGRLHDHPLHASLARTRRISTSLLSQFHMTPASRKKSGLSPKVKASGWLDELTKGGGEETQDV